MYNPAMGVSIENIRTGYRRFSHQSHVIFYTQMQDGILIARVLHKRMDVTKQLLQLLKKPSVYWALRTSWDFVGCVNGGRESLEQSSGNLEL